MPEVIFLSGTILMVPVMQHYHRTGKNDVISTFCCAILWAIAVIMWLGIYE